ncbi:hypothetical protein ACFV61_21325, partial [Kitasatospora sp. NPDC059817]
MAERTSGWPAVRPEVVAEVVAGLSARLQKRLDGAAAKLAERPVTRCGDEWRVEVDEETALVLRAPGAVVADAADVRCGCLLAPACVHRAAAVMLCPLAELAEEPGEPEEVTPTEAAPAPSEEPQERREPRESQKSQEAQPEAGPTPVGVGGGPPHPPGGGAGGGARGCGAGGGAPAGVVRAAP